MTSKNEKKKVSIAMQGGGAHGAFTWGVMDRLLEDGRFEFEGFSGTSAGAMNAVASVQGLMEGGNEGARKKLEEFWMRNAAKGKDGPLHPGFLDQLLGKFTMYNTPEYLAFDMMTRFLSPYQFNPLKKDPLKDVVDATFDFEALRKEKKYKAFLCATRVRDGKLRIFSNEELETNALLASACLPTIHQAVMVENEYYWDGGFIGNPAIYPLIDNCESRDIIVIQLNPTHRPDLPKSVREISDRLNEISNNVSLMREMRAIHMITDLMDKGLLDEKKMKRVYMHLIRNESTFMDLGFSSKLNSGEDFLRHLFEEGRKTADAWIKENYNDIGKKATAHFQEDFI